MAKKKFKKRTTSPSSNPTNVGQNKMLLDHDLLIKFSYKYLDLHHHKFTIKDREPTYFFRLLQRLKDLSSFTVLELQTSRSKSLRFHDIVWRDTSETGFGLPNEEQLFETPWQFEVSVNEHGRVHGFFIGNVFYPVWLDPNHDLYPRKA